MPGKEERREMIYTARDIPFGIQYHPVEKNLERARSERPNRSGFGDNMYKVRSGSFFTRKQAINELQKIEKNKR